MYSISNTANKSVHWSWNCKWRPAAWRKSSPSKARVIWCASQGRITADSCQYHLEESCGGAWCSRHTSGKAYQTHSCFVLYKLPQILILSKNYKRMEQPSAKHGWVDITGSFKAQLAKHFWNRQIYLFYGTLKCCLWKPWRLGRIIFIHWGK